MLEDIAAAIKPMSCRVTGDFTPRGGLITSVEARWSRANAGKSRGYT